MICVGDACNPPKNTIVEAVVKNKNALGLLAESYTVIDGKNLPVLDIIVPKRAAGISSEIDLDSLYIGDTINVMIMGKSYQLNDLKISVIGRGVKSSPASYANVNESVESDNQEESDENASDTSSEHSDDSNENESAINEESDQEEGTAKQTALIIGGGIEDDLIDDGVYVGGDDEEEDDLEGADAGSEADYFDEQEY
jgi:pyruvoyl-dependent arginine decarboxylase (PvlArgDC)